MTNSISRRQFVSTSAAIGTAIATTRTQAQISTSANEKIRLGVIGSGNRGAQVTKAFLEHDDVELVAICDCDQSQLTQFAQRLKTDARQYADFRDLLDRKDIDAVLVSTPDHWHALQTIMACRAGKDVYVEKPLSVTIHEGRTIVQVARETKRVVQVGTHRRSSPVWIKTIEMIKSGVLGNITMCQAYRTNNMAPNGIGKVTPTNPTQRSRLEHVVGATQFPSLPKQHYSLQVSLVVRLFVPIWQLGESTTLT